MADYKYYTKTVYGTDYSVPINYAQERSASLTDNELDILVKETEKLGRALTDTELKELGLNPKKTKDLYNAFLDQNVKKFGFDSKGKVQLDKEGNVVTDKYGDPVYKNSTSDEFSSGIDEYRTLMQDSLMADARGQMANDFRTSMYGAINSYEQATNAALAQTEVDAYRMLGQQQLQLENQIAAQRQQALKSGTTSAQLASQELANMFAAQTGASQVATNMAATRAQNYNQFNQQRAAVEGDLYNMVNANQNALATGFATLGTAQASYNSYIQQALAQYNAATNALNTLGPDKYAQMLGTKQ